MNEAWVCGVDAFEFSPQIILPLNPPLQDARLPPWDLFICPFIHLSNKNIQISDIVQLPQHFRCCRLKIMLMQHCFCQSLLVLSNCVLKRCSLDLRQMLSALQAAVRGEAPLQIRETGLERREEAAPLGEAATNIGSAGETAGLPRHLAQVLLILDLVVVVVVRAGLLALL